MKMLNSILIKPSGPDCNMACHYCFYLEKAALFKEKEVHRMSNELLEITVRQMLEQGGRDVSFGWQGGDTTLMGLDFYSQAVSFQKKYARPGQVIGNGFQTNGVLIDADWAKFLHENNFLVGLSLDGPQHIHDRYRCLANGQSSWQRVCEARDIMLENQVEVNGLVVVTDYSVQFPEEIYQYHKANGLMYQQYIPCVEPAQPDSEEPAGFSVSGPAYGEFLCRLFDLWLADFIDGKPTISIRWFDSLFYSYVGMPAPECTLLKECGVYVVVEHNGDIYSCDFFVLPEWKLGNVMTHRLVDALNSPRQQQFGYQKSNLPEKCRNCRWLSHCFGGCPKDRLPTISHFCEGYQQFFEYADDTFQNLAAKWKLEQRREYKKNNPQLFEA
ncbi:anaerobic sulfatase maturase, partial [bacterium]|nr:anaerobic sulfatase maturase [bacterium]